MVHLGAQLHNSAAGGMLVLGLPPSNTPCGGQAVLANILATSRWGASVRSTPVSLRSIATCESWGVKLGLVITGLTARLTASHSTYDA